MSFPAADEYGHIYNSAQEVLHAIAWLENDAKYLASKASTEQNEWVKSHIAVSMQHSASYAARLRDLL